MFRQYKVAIAAAILLGSTSLAAAALATVETDLNLRAGPGTEFPGVRVLSDGAAVNVLSCDGAWCRVNYRGSSGYTSARYLAFAGAPAVAVAPVYEYDYPAYDYGYYGASPGVEFRFGAFGRRHFGSRHFQGRHFGGRHFGGRRGRGGVHVGGAVPGPRGAPGMHPGASPSPSTVGRGGGGIGRAGGAMGRAGGAMSRGGMGMSHAPATVGGGGGGLSRR